MTVNITNHFFYSAGYPVAAVEHGRQVLVAVDRTFMGLADHDFTKAGIIPSVSLV